MDGSALAAIAAAGTLILGGSVVMLVKARRRPIDHFAAYLAELSAPDRFASIADPAADGRVISSPAGAPVSSHDASHRADGGISARQLDGLAAPPGGGPVIFLAVDNK